MNRAENLLPDKNIPGPGQYDYGLNSGSKVINSSFASKIPKSKYSYMNENNGVPGPGTYM